MTALLAGVATVAVVAGAGLAAGDIAAAGAARAGARDRVVVRGRATLDGASFDAPYLGAVVRRRGLVTPCQHTLPEVSDGRFAITVLARTEALGCGEPGGRIALWTFVHDQIVYSEQFVPWPGNGATVRFRPRFSSGSPDGGVGPVVGFAGEISDGRVGRLPPGAKVEAFIGTTRCAVATTRRSDDFVGFSIDVVGPGAIPDCVIGGTITFKVDGRDARETAVNRPGRDTTLNLFLKRT